MGKIGGKPTKYTLPKCTGSGAATLHNLSPLLICPAFNMPVN